MSHLNAFKTEMTDQESLIRALVRAGIKRQHIEVHQTAQPMTDYYGGTNNVANIIIRKGHTTIPSDIGWELVEGNYVAHLDEHNYTDRNWIESGAGPGSTVYNGAWSTRLMDYYIAEKKTAELVAQGLTVTETVDDQNRIILRAKYNIEENEGLIQSVGG